MALIVYPADGWDSFGTLAEIDDFITKNLVAPEWIALDDTTKEIYARQATTLISSCPNITLPDDTSDALMQGQAITAVYALSTPITGYDPNERSVKRQKVDVIEIEYDTALKGQATTIPPYAQTYLSQYGCKQSTGGFSQTYAGRS